MSATFFIREREQAEPDQVEMTISQTDIDQMKKDAVIELLEAHGVENPKGKADDLKAKLKEIMFLELDK